MNENKKHIHIIGICGVATSALAIAFYKKGWRVSGSDKGFYPPVSTALEQTGIPFYAGWHPEKMTSPEFGGVPNIVIIGTASGTQNPETAWVRDHNIPIKSDAEVRGQFFAKKNSIVCAGTWGKTSNTALLSHIFIEAGLDPSYVIGGLSLSTDAAHFGDSDWSIIEGDEYKSSPTDNRPKFAHIKTTHLLLTSVSWDHADLYPTEKAYFDEFAKLVGSIPSNRLIVCCSDDAGVKKIISAAKCKVVTYGKSNTENMPDYAYHSVSHTKNGLSFVIDKKSTNGVEHFSITSPMLGRFNVENIAGCFAMASESGIDPQKIVTAITDFKGIKRRLEKRHEGAVAVLDCLAPTAEKAQSVLQSIREVYDKKIIAVYEPNIGGRQRESIEKYNNAFSDVDTVIIPRLTKLKIDETKEKALEGAELADFISKTHNNVVYIDNDDMLVEKIVGEVKTGDVIAFLGSHGFRGMIEQTIAKLK